MVPDHPRCSECPIVGRCVFEWTGHAPYCWWAKRGGAWLDRVRELSEAGEPDISDAADRPSVAETISLLAAMKRCPYRATFPPCGCQGSRCGLKNGAIVSHQQCFDCLRAYG